MDCEPMMDARKVASLLGISLRTLDTLVARGEAPAFIRIGQIRRWRMAEVTTWIEARLGTVEPDHPRQPSPACIRAEGMPSARFGS